MRSLNAIVSVLLLVAFVAEGAEKKAKEIPTQICKRGKLIFEDDFSGKELLWTFDESKCFWKIVKGTLVTSSANESFATRNFSPVVDLVLEARFIMPPKSFLSIVCGKLDDLHLYPHVDTHRQVIALRQFKKEGAVSLEISQFSYQEKRPITLLFEALRGRFNLTVDGKSVTHECESSDDAVTWLQLRLTQDNPGVFAADYIKLWEALPKGEIGGKEKKK